jgi:hypothetical protein
MIVVDFDEVSDPGKVLYDRRFPSGIIRIAGEILSQLSAELPMDVVTSFRQCIRVTAV